MESFGSFAMAFFLSLTLGLLLWRMIVPAILVSTGVLESERLAERDGVRQAARAAKIAAGVWTTTFVMIAIALWQSSVSSVWIFAPLGAAFVPVIIIPNLLRVVRRASLNS